MISTRVRALLAAVLILAALAVIVHTPPFRALVLRYAIRTVQDRYGIHIAAARLDYNLASLHVGLSDVRMAASGDPAPFFAADRVDVDLARSALVGDIAFQHIAATRARVTVLRRADGTTNLPRSSEEAGEPAALRVARLVAPSTRVELRDEQADLAVTVPDVSINLAPTTGRIAIGMPARITYAGKSSEVPRLAGDASFDGRDLRLNQLRVTATEGSAQIDGVLRVIRRETGLDVRVTSTVNLPQVARWGVDPQQAPSGSAAVSGRVYGPFDALSAEMTLTSDAVGWSGLQASQVRGQARLAPDRLIISEASLRLANGRVDVRGDVPFDTSQASELHLSWSGVDVDALVSRLAPAASVRPAGSMSGMLDARGSGVLPTWNADGRLRIDAAANARGRLAIPGDTRLQLAARTVRIEAEHRVAGIAPVALSLRARLDTPELRSAPLSGSMRAGATSLPGIIDALTVVGIAGVPSDLVTAGSLEGTADVAGTLSAPRIHFRAATVDAAAASGAAGHITASGEYDVARAGFQVTAILADWAVVPQPDRPLRATVSGQLTVEGRAAQVSGEGDLTARDVTWSDIAIGPIDTHFTLANDVAHVRTQVPEFALTAEGDVGTAAPYRAAITATASNLDLSRALRDVDLPEPVTGMLSARVQASGTIQQWRAGRAQLEVSDLEAHAADLTLRLREPVQAQYENERVQVDRLEARVSAAGNANGSGTLVSVSGALPIDAPTAANSSDSLLATVTGDVGEVLEAVRSARVADVPAIVADGPFVLLSRIGGTATAPTYSADLELGPASATIRDDLPPVENVRLRAHLENDIVELREAAASYADAMLDASARAPLDLLVGSSRSSTSTATFRARATGLTPAVLQGLVAQSTLDQLSGTVDASLDLTTPVGRTLSGPAADPTLPGPAQRVLESVEGELRLDRFDVAVAGLPLTQRQPTRVRLQRGLARIESWEWVGQGRSLSVAGQMRLSDRQAAILAAGDLDVGLLAPFVRTTGVSIAGRLQPRLSITGTIDNPRIDGDATVTGGEVRISYPRVVLSDVTARAVLTRRSVHLLSVTGTANGGALQANGSIDFPSDAPLGAQLAATVTGMPIEFPQGLRSEVNADLSLALAGSSGTSSPGAASQTVTDQISGGTLSGTVTVVRGAYRDPLPVVAGLLTSARARNTTIGVARSPTLEKLALDIRVVTDEDLIVDNNVARLQMGGDLRVIGTAAAPSLSGRVEIRDGGQLYFGRNVYRLDEPGTIDFSNPALIEPDVNITAVTRAGGEDIKVTLAGTPDTLSPTLSSPNGALGQADLAALLLTGRTMDRLPDDQAAIIGAELLSNVSGDVLGFAGRAVGLDVLRLGGVATAGARRDTSDLATEVDPTTRLTFGKSLGRNVDVTLSQSLRDGDEQTWIVDYLPARQLALRFVSNDEDLRSYEFRHDLSFGGGTTGRRSVVRNARPVPPRVSTVTITGDLGFPEAQLRRELSLEAGDRFDFIAWQTDRDRLQDFYIAHRHLAARITASRAGDANAVALTYTVTAGPETAIVVTGFTIDRAVLHDIEGAWAISVVDELLLDQSQGIVRDVVVKQGYPRASVSASLDTVAGIRMLTIAVTPGAKAEPPPGSAPAKPTPIVGAVAFVRSPAPGSPGPTTDALRSTADLSSGAPADLDAVEEARDRVQRLFRREGFATARVTVRQEVHSDSGTSDVTFDILEGPRQVVGEVVIEGNRGIDTDVVARAVRLDVGQPLRAQDWLDARRRVFDTALFRRVDVRSEPMESTETTARMRVRVAVEEWPALRLRYGFQAAEERPEGSLTGRNIVPGISADLTRRTLFGRAVGAVAAVELQRRDRSARGTLNAPTFLRLPVSSSLVLERSRQEFAAATLVTDRGGLSWEQRSELANNRLNLSYAYRFERNHTFDTEPSTNPFFPAFDITINIARLTAVGAWDSRDDAGDTTRGSLLSYTFEYAPASLGSDIRFVRHLTQAYSFRSWRGVVFGSAARLGFVSPLGGQELIPSVRFFSGGARSVRGVAEDGLGPRDFFGDPAGGEALLILNHEARFPIYRWLRGVGFVDAGNVFSRPGDFGFGNLVGAVGGGLRLVTPVALLRVDYGRQMWPGPRQGSGQWFFGVGQSF